MKLNLGCDDDGIEGYLGVDKLLMPNSAAGIQADVMALPFADDSIDEIWASHLLEHLEWDQKPFEEWFRVLKPGGEVTVAFPDVFEVMLRMYEGRVTTYWWNCAIFGGHKFRPEMHPEFEPGYFDHFKHEGHIHNQALTGPMVLNDMWGFFPDAKMVNDSFVRGRMLDVGETMITGHKPEVEDVA